MPRLGEREIKTDSKKLNLQLIPILFYTPVFAFTRIFLNVAFEKDKGLYPAVFLIYLKKKAYAKHKRKETQHIKSDKIISVLSIILNTTKTATTTATQFTIKGTRYFFLFNNPSSRLGSTQYKSYFVYLLLKRNSPLLLVFFSF